MKTQFCPHPRTLKFRGLSLAFAPSLMLNAFRAAPRVNEDSAHPSASRLSGVHGFR